MIPLGEWVLFTGAALLMVLTPGPNMIYLLSRSVCQGRRAGFVSLLGVVVGFLVHVCAAAIGLTAVFMTVPLAYELLKWAGAAYLLWLAFGMLRDAWRGRAPETVVAKVAPASLRTVFAQGFLTNVLNPKVALFFLALLPQFIDSDAASKPLAFLFLGAVFIVNGTLFLFVLVAVAAHARRLRVVPNARRALNAAGGALFATLAARLAMAER